jgi:hypothetical protein
MACSRASRGFAARRLYLRRREARRARGRPAPDRQRLALRRFKLSDVRAIFFGPVDHDPVLTCSRYRRFLLPHSSSASRFTAGAAEFFILSQSGERPER